LFKLIPLLLKYSSPKIKALGRFLEYLKFYHDAWTDDSLDTWRQTKEYSENAVSQQVIWSLKMTLFSLKEFVKLSTLIVENFFSKIRGKIQHPNLWQFACTYASGWREMIKKFATDCPYNIRKDNIGKKYPLAIRTERVNTY